ncbi:MAG: hypothetical protein L0H84_02530 [Pseudonocardia sp.]|nr:hypothetical protein [Pseudonocardia sp.]
MAQTYSLLEFVHRLATGDDLRADFAADPRGVLAEHGLDGLAPQDVRDALLLVDDVRTVEYRADHTVEAGPALDPAGPDTGPDSAVQYFSDYAGLPTESDGAFDVDPTGDIDDLDGYAAATPQPARPAAGDEVVDDTGAGFGHGSAGADVPTESAPPADLTAGDTGRHEPEDPGAPAPDPVFDEPGSYEEFGAADTFDHPRTYDDPTDEPGHPQ